MDKVCFFSNADMSIGSNLELAEKRIKELEEYIPTDIEGIIELWHIRKLIEVLLPKQEWLQEHERLKNKTTNYFSIVAKYFKQLNPKVVANEYRKLEWLYRKTFWTIIEQFKCYNAVDADLLKSIGRKDINDLRLILYNRGIVEKYKQVVKDILLQEKYSAHLLLDEFVARPSSHDEHLYFPSCLNVNEREDIIVRYLDSEDPNLNYVRLIVQTKNIDAKFVLSPKTRLKAERLERKLNDELMRDPRTCLAESRIAVSFTDFDNSKIWDYSFENGGAYFKYNKRIIKTSSTIDKILYCGFVFEWVNTDFMLNLINKNCEVDGLEHAFMDKSKTSYPNYNTFNFKNDLAIMQLGGYCNVLEQFDISLERLLESFYFKYLKEDFGYPGLQIKLPKKEDGWLEKCRILFPELDNIARQYDTYIDEDEIDPDYLSILPPQKMIAAKSLFFNKYCEINEGCPIFVQILDWLFGSASLLMGVKHNIDNQYNSFVDLIIHESICYDLYREFQKDRLNILIDNGIIKLDELRIIRCVNLNMLFALKTIWEFGSCSYWHYNEVVRKSLDEFISKGWLVTDDHLLSKKEREYFSYYTDNSIFTNGFAYRNHYAHGCTPATSDEKAHIIAYFTMLRLLIILMLKIYDDLRLAKNVIKHYAFKRLSKKQ